MDISAFSEDNFDVQEWINRTFKSVETMENKEAFISSMVSKLQLYVQQVNSALEDTSQQVLQNLPRIMHDADMINKEALLLKDKMQSVKEEIAKIERDTGESMASLERLDKLKTELQLAKQAIHEADNWTLLATDIEDVFESHDIDAIANKVVSMQQSLKVLSNSGDFEDRKLQLEAFKNRLEAIASPLLVEAFTNNNIHESKKYVGIFKSIERLPQLLKYYAKCQKGSLCQEWHKLVDLDQDHGLQEWLKAYYDLLLINWQTQVKWCQEVFGEWEVVARVYCEVLVSLDPNPSECIDTAIKQHSNPLQYVMQLKATTEHFMINLNNAIAQQGANFNRTNLYEAVYSIYIGAISRYKELEEKQVSDDMSELISSGIIERVGSSPLAPARASHSRCMSFTHCTAYPALLQALQSCLLKYLDQYRIALRQIDLDKQHKDEWTMFRVSLTLLQNAGELLLEVEELDRELVQGISASTKLLKSEEINMKSILLTKTGLEEYNMLVNSIRDLGEEASVLENVVAKLQKICSRAYQSMFDTMFSPISVQLELAKIGWANNQSSVTHQMPDYSYAPLEYITQIGEYIMTLPQHLEPFVLRENNLGLSRALACVSKGEGSPPADMILGSVAKHTSAAFTDLILSINELSPNAAKQLSIDIGYLGNVLEDLGFGLSENLEQISTLLKLSPDNYQSQSTGCAPKLVATIRQMRNITSS